MEKIVINIDGGSRGNPGEGAIGAVFGDGKDKAIKKYSQAIGFCTNNEAEYKALVFALKKTKALFGKEKVKSLEIEIRSDSELLIRQMKGEYKIQDEKIGKLFLEIWNLRIDLPKIGFVLIPREQNVLADKLVNEALDGKDKARTLF
ncbi:MAG: ribonuclease HI family protein [Candidatus Pacebacteria bacterium]|nr:ribonuclease HI family protein [Candidatus Paceibacterota bacterium]